MSFIKTLATLAAGFAAAKGYDKFRKMGGAPAVNDSLKNAGAAGGMADQIGRMVENMGVPGAAASFRDMAAKLGPKAAEASQAAEAGIGGLIASLQGSAAAGAGTVGELISTMTGASPASDMIEENARLMIRAMIQAAKADGDIDPDEKARIMAHLATASVEERAYVDAQMAAPLDLDGLAAATGAAMKAQVYSTSLMAVKVDGPVEGAYLRRLSDALGLDAAARDKIHVSMGLPPLAG